MATIRTAIALYDGVTAPLQAMHKAMNIVLNSFEAMQRASGNSVDVSSIQEAREELARAGAAFDSIEQNIRDAGNQQDASIGGLGTAPPPPMDFGASLKGICGHGWRIGGGKENHWNF